MREAVRKRRKAAALPQAEAGVDISVSELSFKVLPLRHSRILPAGMRVIFTCLFPLK